MLLTIIGFMTCVLYLMVLIQWVRDTKRAKNIVSGAENRATKGSPTAHARVLGLRKDAARGRSIAIQSSLRAAVEEHDLEVSGPGWSAIERNVYETIARSLIGGRAHSSGDPVLKAS